MLGLRPMLAAAIAGLIIAACGPAAAQELRSHVPRANADPAAAQDVRAAMDAFSADLYRVLAREQGNVILSPFSVEVALASVVRRRRRVLRGRACAGQRGALRRRPMTSSVPRHRRSADEELP